MAMTARSSSEREAGAELRVHGGRIDLAATLYPDSPRPWLDLSTGINPLGWKPAEAPQIDLTSLPSPAALEDLEAAAARVFGVAAERVVAVPGSELGLRALERIGLPGPFRFAVPSYATHASIFPDALPIARGAIGSVTEGTVLLANPNNPDGLVDHPAMLVDTARRGPWLVVDEAFVDTMPEASVVQHLASDDRVVVFRSFGKFFGLPGVRLGFMIAPVDRVAAMRRVLGAWPISASAIAYGTAAYRDAAWIERTRRGIADRAADLDERLSRLGFPPRGACPLFRLIETPQASRLFDRLARAGILTRTFDHAPHWLRIGLPADEAAIERLERALAGE